MPGTGGLYHNAGIRSDWWRAHFDAVTLAGYGLRPKAAREADRASGLLAVRPGARILDLCCGAGRHAVRFAERGYRVTGLDIKADLLEAAREEASRRGVSLELARGDARRLPWSARFDAVACLFTSFGYFAREEDDLAVLRSARRALKPGGRLLLDLLNKEWLMRRFTPRFSQRGEGPVRRVDNRLSFDFLRGRLDNRRTLFLKDGTRRETALSIRVYTLVELTRLLAAAGLRFDSAYGGLDGRPYGLGTFRMVVTASRPRFSSIRA